VRTHTRSATAPGVPFALALARASGTFETCNALILTNDVEWFVDQIIFPSVTFRSDFRNAANLDSRGVEGQRRTLRTSEIRLPHPRIALFPCSLFDETNKAKSALRPFPARPFGFAQPRTIALALSLSLSLEPRKYLRIDENYGVGRRGARADESEGKDTLAALFIEGNCGCFHVRGRPKRSNALRKGEGAVWTVEDNSPRRTKCRDRPRLGEGGGKETRACARRTATRLIRLHSAAERRRRGEGGIYPSRAGKSNASTE